MIPGPHRAVAALMLVAALAAAPAPDPVATPTAPAAPTSPAVTQLTNVTPLSAFDLTPDWSDETLATSLRTTINAPATLADLMDDLDDNTSACDPSQLAVLPEKYTGSHTRLRSSSHFCWSTGDSDVAYWIPQGVSGSYDGAIDGTLEDQSFMAVSWYYAPAAVPADPHPPASGTTKGVRISFVNAAHTAYRSVLLVEPTSASTFAAVPVHAGGISLAGHYLYVTDSTRGLRVFDLDQMMTVTTGNNSVIGKSGSNWYAYGYKYILPQVATYYQSTPATGCDTADPRTPTEPVCFGSVALDRSTSPDRLVIGEYIQGGSGGRTVSYSVDKTSRQLIAASSGTVVAPVAAVLEPVGSVQGAISWAVSGTTEHYYMNSSNADAFGLMAGGTVGGGTPALAGMTIGGEDLYHQQIDTNGTAEPGQLWTLTEHAYCDWSGGTCGSPPDRVFLDQRVVFSVLLSSIPG